MDNGQCTIYIISIGFMVKMSSAQNKMACRAPNNGLHLVLQQSMHGNQTFSSNILPSLSNILTRFSLSTFIGLRIVWFHNIFFSIFVSLMFYVIAAFAHICYVHGTLIPFFLPHCSSQFRTVWFHSKRRKKWRIGH